MLKILAVFAVLLIFVIPGVWAEVYIENDYQYVSNDNTCLLYTSPSQRD